MNNLLAIAMLIATALGPVVAVLITLWYQNREQTYQRKLFVFRSLMQWRANWLQPEWVGALNLVPVEFPRNGEIIAAFVALIDKLQDNGFAGNPEELTQAFVRAQTTFIELLQKIARDLKIDMSNFDLRERVYAPKGWQEEQVAIQTVRHAAFELFSGAKTLKVSITE